MFERFLFYQDWSHVSSKGGFFIGHDGVISSYEYKLQINRDTDVFITIQPAPNKKGLSCICRTVKCSSVVMMNYVWDFSQSEMEKYFEWIIM